MRLLDLFCGAGGAAHGYARAGFKVVGVDKEFQPNYPFTFVCADALEILERARYGLLGAFSNDPPRSFVDVAAFDAIHASPPCQAFTAYNRARPGNEKNHEDLVGATREALKQTGLPYVIENVEGAPLEDPAMLCGSMFDLDVERHRFFETNWNLQPPMWPCRHKVWSPRYPASTNRRKNSRLTVAVGQWNTEPEVQARAMGIDWMTVDELSQAIPPRYTEFIGRQLIGQLQEVAA